MYAATGSSRGVIPVQPSRALQHQHNQQSGLLKSSLDIVWSYSRSQAFFGSNLPSSPSFIERYRRPGKFSASDEDNDSYSSARRRGRLSGDTSEVTATDEEHSDGGERGDEDAGESDEDEDDDDSEEDEHWVPELDGTGSGQQLPWNAVAASSSSGKKRRRSSGKKRRNSSVTKNRAAKYGAPGGNSLGLTEEAIPTSVLGLNIPDSTSTQSLGDEPRHSPLPVNERTPLLEKLPRTQNLPPPEADDRIYSSSPPEAFPYPRRSPHLKKRRLSARRRSHAYVPEGSSTSGQTLFNAINVLVGIGILAQPLAFSQAGWVIGIILVLFCSLLTNYTAKVLAKVLQDDQSLMTYADIGAKAFGAPARNFINLLFCLEISALCVALIILLGDSLATLLPGSPTFYKLIGFCLLFPTLFLPLRYLSIASLIGIMSVVTLTITVLVDGCISHSQPGSLHHPMPTSIGPNWHQLPISFGLIMSGFGGHAVFPSLARDMKNPKDFNRVCDLAFLVATGFYLFMGVVGYLMFGNHVSDEITRDLLSTKTLPRKLNLVAVCMVAITPICKYAISSTPLEGTISYLLGVEEPATRIRMKSGSGFKDSDLSSRTQSFSESDYDDLSTPTAGVSQVQSSSFASVLSAIHQPLANVPPRSKIWFRQFVKLITALTLLAIAIFIPAFDRVMGLLGAFSVFMICAIGPIATNLALHRHTMSTTHKVLDVILLFISVVMATVGTVWVFMPKRP